MGEHVVGRVGELSIRSSRPRIATKRVLEGFDAVEDMPDVAEIGTAVIGAEGEGLKVIGNQPSCWSFRRLQCVADNFAMYRDTEPLIV